jgi:hypothetical protein
VTTRAIALYAFAGWAYVALVALVEPKTLPLRLTHLASWPRTDTFGVACFVVSLVAYWLYGMAVASSTRGGGPTPDR